VSELMSILFAMRRNSIITEPKPLIELLQTYPFLKDRDEVRVYYKILKSYKNVIQMIAELGRLHDQKAIRTIYLNEWTTQWLPKITIMIKENMISRIEKLIQPT